MAHILKRFKSITGFSWLFCLAVFVYGCENDTAEVLAFNQKKREVEEGKGIKADFSQSGILKADMVAPLMLRVKADTPYTEFPKSVHVNFYKEDKSIESVVDAQYAIYYETLGKVFLRDSVVVYNTTGDTLHCDDLWWDQNMAVFYTDNKVVIHTPTQQLYGSGLWALANFSKYIIKTVSGSVAIPDSIQP